jgi:hypothetical protein
VLPAQPEHLTVTVLDGKIHAVGGRWRDRGNLAALEIYDPTADAYHFICSTAPCCRLP